MTLDLQGYCVSVHEKSSTSLQWLAFGNTVASTVCKLEPVDSFAQHGRSGKWRQRWNYNDPLREYSFSCSSG